MKIQLNIENDQPEKKLHWLAIVGIIFILSEIIFIGIIIFALLAVGKG